jgi:hypothetical protein
MLGNFLKSLLSSRSSADRAGDEQSPDDDQRLQYYQAAFRRQLQDAGRC